MGSRVGVEQTGMATAGDVDRQAHDFALVGGMAMGAMDMMQVAGSGQSQVGGGGNGSERSPGGAPGRPAESDKPAPGVQTARTALQQSLDRRW